MIEVIFLCFFCFVVFSIDIGKMISNATSSVNKMRDDLRKISNDVSLQPNICIWLYKQHYSSYGLCSIGSNFVFILRKTKTGLEKKMKKIKWCTKVFV